MDDKAFTTLSEDADLDQKCPHWYFVMLEIARDQGWDKQLTRSLFERAIALEPAYYHSYREYANDLLPKWNGERGEAEAQAMLVRLWKCFAQSLIKQESGFKVRSGRRVFDGAHSIAQVELLRSLFNGAKQALQAAPKVGCLADVGLGVCIFAPQKEDRGAGGNDGEDLPIPLRRKFQALSQHKVIVSKYSTGEARKH